jgi:ZIP family zinc transporter
MTGLGAAGAFLINRVSPRVTEPVLGFAAGGVMIAVSFWGLLAPAIALGESGSLPSWAPAAIGFALGGAFYGWPTIF